DILWPFQMQYLLALAFILGMLALLERRTRRGDIAASGMLLLSLASGSLALPAAAGAAAEIVWSDRSRRRLWIVGLPAALYAAWWLRYHAPVDYPSSNLLAVPSYGATLAANAVGGLAGLGLDWGRPLAIALVTLA